MFRGGQKKQKYLAAGVIILLLFLAIDLVRSQNMVQFTYSHFQACLLEYDQALESFLKTGDREYLEVATSAVEHVEHMDAGFLKFHCLSEPLYRKRRTALTDYLRLLTDYSKKLEKSVYLEQDLEEAIRTLYDGNREIEELLVEDSMDFDEIDGKTQREVLKRIGEMTEMIRNKM